MAKWWPARGLNPETDFPPAKAAWVAMLTADFGVDAAAKLTTDQARDLIGRMETEAASAPTTPVEAPASPAHVEPVNDDQLRRIRERIGDWFKAHGIDPDTESERAMEEWTGYIRMTFGKERPAT